MGYRTYSSGDQGTVKGGSADISVIKETFLLGVLHRLYQKSTGIVRRYAGVSLSTAQTLCTASATLYNYKMTQSSGNATAWDTALSCCGTKQRASYSQIGDSNLYEVQVEDITLGVSESGSSWNESGNV